MRTLPQATSARPCVRILRGWGSSTSRSDPVGLAAGGHAHITDMPTIEFTDTECTALAAFLREAIAADPYPLAPRWRPIRAVLEKIDPRPARAPLPPLKPPGEPSLVLRKMVSGKRAGED